jgi:hypothetical protein
MDLICTIDALDARHVHAVRDHNALLGHLGRLLHVLRVDRLPLLHPVVGGLGRVDDLFPGNVFLLTSSKELEELDLLLRVELSPEGAGSDELQAKLVSDYNSLQMPNDGQ